MYTLTIIYILLYIPTSSIHVIYCGLPEDKCMNLNVYINLFDINFKVYLGPACQMKIQYLPLDFHGKYQLLE